MIPRLHRSTEIGYPQTSNGDGNASHYLTLVVDRCRSRVHGGPQQLGGDVRRALSERDCAVQTVAIVQEQLCKSEVGHLEDKIWNSVTKPVFIFFLVSLNEIVRAAW